MTLSSPSTNTPGLPDRSLRLSVPHVDSVARPETLHVGPGSAYPWDWTPLEPEDYCDGTVDLEGIVVAWVERESFPLTKRDGPLATTA